MISKHRKSQFKSTPGEEYSRASNFEQACAEINLYGNDVPQRRPMD